MLREGVVAGNEPYLTRPLLGKHTRRDLRAPSERMRLEFDNRTIEYSALTPARRELRDALNTVAPSLAELYHGAVLLLYQYRLPGRMRFVAHAVREIRNRIPDAIGGRVATKPVDYMNAMDNIAKLWNKAGLDAGEAMVDLSSFDLAQAKVSTRPQLPQNLFNAISTLVRHHNQSRETRGDQAKRLFRSCGSETEKNIEVIGPAIDQWLEVTEWFVKNAHDSGKTDDAYEEPLLIQRFEVFELCLLTLLGEFFGAASEELDEILAEANK